MTLKRHGSNNRREIIDASFVLQRTYSDRGMIDTKIDVINTSPNRTPTDWVFISISGNYFDRWLIAAHIGNSYGDTDNKTRSGCQR